VPSASRCSCGGRQGTGDSSPTRSSSTTTGYDLRRAGGEPTSPRSCRRATKRAAGGSRCTSTATTAAVPDGEGMRSRARLHLLQRRRRPRCVRFDNWKVVFMEQRCAGRWRSGPNPSCRCVCEALQPADRPARACRHHLQHVLRLVPLQAVHARAAAGIVEDFLATFGVPARQRAATFTIDQALEKMQAAMGGAGH